MNIDYLGSINALGPHSGGDCGGRRNRLLAIRLVAGAMTMLNDEQRKALHEACACPLVEGT